MSRRDEFSESTRKVLAERVAWRCSFPGCGVITVGPKMGDASKSLNLGEAAHIHAAAPGGPRYDPNMSKEDRKGPNNGVWMCRSHATFIDADHTEYSADTISQWKAEAEESAYENLKYPERVATVKPSTLLMVGMGILVSGRWRSVANNEWEFELISFVKGSEESLRIFVSSFFSLQPKERFIIVESQGDGRRMIAPAVLSYASGALLLKVTIGERHKPINPEYVGSDLALGDDGDLKIENGDLATVSGVNAAIQSVVISLSVVYGSWWADPNMGSFVSEYYWIHRSDLSLLGRLIKMEFVRLSLVGSSDNPTDETFSPALPFIDRVLSIEVSTANLSRQRLPVNVSLILGNGSTWTGSVNICIDEI